MRINWLCCRIRRSTITVWWVSPSVCELQLLIRTWNLICPWWIINSIHFPSPLARLVACSPHTLLLLLFDVLIATRTNIEFLHHTYNIIGNVQQLHTNSKDICTSEHRAINGSSDFFSYTKWVWGVWHSGMNGWKNWTMNIIWINQSFFFFFSEKILRTLISFRV